MSDTRKRVALFMRAKEMQIKKSEIDKIAQAKRKRELERKAAKRDIACYLDLSANALFTRKFERDTLRLVRMR